MKTKLLPHPFAALLTALLWISNAQAADKPLWNAAWITDTQTAECEWIAGDTPSEAAVNLALKISELM